MTTTYDIPANQRCQKEITTRSSRRPRQCTRPATCRSVGAEAIELQFFCTQHSERASEARREAGIQAFRDRNAHSSYLAEAANCGRLALQLLRAQGFLNDRESLASQREVISAEIQRLQAVRRDRIFVGFDARVLPTNDVDCDSLT